MITVLLLESLFYPARVRKRLAAMRDKRDWMLYDIAATEAALRGGPPKIISPPNYSPLPEPSKMT